MIKFATGSVTCPRKDARGERAWKMVLGLLCMATADNTQGLCVVVV